MVFEPHLLHDDADRVECVAEVARLQSTREREAHAPRIALLQKIIALYDDEFLRARTPDPIDAIVYRMQQLGLRQADVARWLGGRNRASEVLARKRPLSLSMIEALGRELRIPLDVLISGSKRGRSPGRT